MDVVHCMDGCSSFMDGWMAGWLAVDLLWMDGWIGRIVSHWTSFLVYGTSVRGETNTICKKQE